MRRTVLLFPGQGAYFPGVLRDRGMDDPVVREVFTAIDRAAYDADEPPVTPVLFDRPALALEDMVEQAPDALQLALFGICVVVFDDLRRREVQPWALLGHSVGEIAAVTCAGAYSVEDGARIMHLRNRALREHAAPGRMLAVGADAGTASAIAHAVNDPRLAVACRNAPRESVLSGPDESIERAAAVAAALGLWHFRLRTPHAYHCPLLAGAVEPFRRSMAGIRQRPLQHPLQSTGLGRAYQDDDDITGALAANLTRPVGLLDAVRDLHARGAEAFAECGARDILSRLVAQTVPGVATVTCLDQHSGGPSSLEAAARLLAADDAGRATSPAAVPSQGSPSADLGRDGLAETRMSSASHPPGPPSGAPIAPEQAAVYLRAVYAQALEYPEEVVTDDADLEADLGVDSVQQTEILGRAANHFGIPLPERLRMADFPTISRIAAWFSAQAASRA